MNFAIERHGKIIIFKIKHDKLDTTIAPEVKAELLIICQPDIEALILDLNQVSSIDSSGLGCLLLASRILSQNKIPIILVGLQPAVKTLINISRIEHLFEYETDLESTLSNLLNS